MENFASRKFIVAMLSLAVNAALAWFSKIDAGVYATVTVTTVGAYLAANVAQKKVTP